VARAGTAGGAATARTRTTEAGRRTHSVACRPSGVSFRRREHSTGDSCMVTGCPRGSGCESPRLTGARHIHSGAMVSCACFTCRLAHFMHRGHCAVRRRLAHDLFAVADPWFQRFAHGRATIREQTHSFQLTCRAAVSGTEPVLQEPRRYRAGQSPTAIFVARCQASSRLSSTAQEQFLLMQSRCSLGPSCACTTAERFRAQPLLLVAGVRASPLAGSSAELPNRRRGRYRGSWAPAECHLKH